MKYIIMCGGIYHKWQQPRQLMEINGQSLVARTIRLLRENGIQDISISSNNPIFKQFNVPVLEHNNPLEVGPHAQCLGGLWIDCFYPVDEPVCYLMGDVCYSPYAIKVIIETETNDIEFFASAPPFSSDYIKSWAQPLAFKVKNLQHFKKAIEKTRSYEQRGLFYRKPISWQLWQVIKDSPLNVINYKNYTVINDYSCDIDDQKDLEKLRNIKID